MDSDACIVAYIPVYFLLIIPYDLLLSYVTTRSFRYGRSSLPYDVLSPADTSTSRLLLRSVTVTVNVERLELGSEPLRSNTPGRVREQEYVRKINDHAHYE